MMRVLTQCFVEEKSVVTALAHFLIGLVAVLYQKIFVIDLFIGMSSPFNCVDHHLPPKNLSRYSSNGDSNMGPIIW